MAEKQQVEEERGEEGDEKDDGGDSSGDKGSGKKDDGSRSVGSDDPTREDEEELPEPEGADVPPPVEFLGRLHDVLYFAIAVILLLLGVAALVRIVTDFISHDDDFAHRVTDVVNGVLFVVIVLELLRTVLAHFEDPTFHLKPFLIIGIISVVRHILTVGAELSIAEEEGGSLFHRSDIELGINALVVVALVIGLVLVRKTE